MQVSFAAEGWDFALEVKLEIVLHCSFPSSSLARVRSSSGSACELWWLVISPSPHIGEAVFARCLSSLKDERIQAGQKLKGPQKVQFEGDKKSFLEDIRKVGCRPAVAAGMGLVGRRPRGHGEDVGSVQPCPLIWYAAFPKPCPR